MAPLPLTIGTAGHIDHGKTALVRALTGRDTDRLPEERRRGMSIELGFAELRLGDRQLSLVDVPGHERFVRTMVAGSSGVDMFLLVIAADDGLMPQTREHLAVLRALGVEDGVVALSKVDLADGTARRSATERASAFAPGVPLIEVSSRTGEGLEELRAMLARVVVAVEARRREREGEADEEPAVLHVDRVFTIVGHGTVVTGTLWSGQLRTGQRVTLLPEGRQARVRSIEIHDRSLDIADSHQRVALNLAGVALDQIQRGDVVTTPEADLHPTYRLDVELVGCAKETLDESRVQVHLGTRDTAARVTDLTQGRAQLRLEQPLLARTGDRVVVRRIAPPDTLGGGVVLDPSPPRHGPGWRPPSDEAEPAPIPAPPSTGPGAFSRQVLAALETDGRRPRGAAQLACDLFADRRQIEAAFGELVAAGEAVRAKADVVYPVRAYEELAGPIIALAERGGSTSIAEVRNALGLSRKYAQALLEQLDSERRLLRKGDRHFPRRQSPH